MDKILDKISCFPFAYSNKFGTKIISTILFLNISCNFRCITFARAKILALFTARSAGPPRTILEILEHRPTRGIIPQVSHLTGSPQL